jgi:2,4'-dihydroxyacetophenone dioxygenase
MSLDMDREILKTLHINTEEIPFIEFLPGTETRLLQVRPSEKLVVTHIRAQPGAVSALHRHPSPVYGWTIQGQWGHDQQFEYRPGSYIFETPGVIHQFLAGPVVTEAVFISTGDLEFIDPETLEVRATATPQQILDQYMAKCEAIGIKPPILS